MTNDDLKALKERIARRHAEHAAKKRPMEELLKKYDITPPYCGAEAGPGWFPLIEKLIQDLIAAGWDKDCHQIKEKFGGLRFYVGAESDEVDALITKAEKDSYRICEKCGQPGQLRSGGWLLTLCDEHSHGRPVHKHAEDWT